MHARQKLTCDFDPFMARRGGTNFDSGRVASGPPHRRARANIHPGGTAQVLSDHGDQSLQIRHPERIRPPGTSASGKSCSRPLEQRERGLEAQGNGKMPSEFRELNPGWGRGHRCTGRTAWIECALGTFGG